MSVTALDALGVGLMAAVVARKSAHLHESTLPPFAFDGMLGLVARYLDLVKHHNKALQTHSVHLLTDSLLYGDAVPVEIRFEAGDEYHQTRKVGLQLLDDLTGGSEEVDQEALSEKVYRYRHILEEEKRVPTDRDKTFAIQLIPTTALHRFAYKYTFANVSVQSARNLPPHDLHLSKFLEGELRNLDLPSLDVLVLDPTSIAFWALEHVASSRNAPFHLLFLLRIVRALETEFADCGLSEEWLAPAAWYSCLATLSPEQVGVLQKGVRAVRRTKVIEAVASWEATMRGRQLEPFMVQRYRAALDHYASIVITTTAFAKFLGEGKIDLEKAHLYPFLPSTSRRPSTPSAATMRNVEAYHKRRHAHHVSTVIEEPDSARGSVHGPHPGNRLSIGPTDTERKLSTAESDAYEPPSALGPSSIDLPSWSEPSSPADSRRPSAASGYTHEPGPPINFFDPSRTSNLWPTNEELSSISSPSSPEVSPNRVRKKRSARNFFRRGSEA
ncbi:uncharacterized protein RHOBADRAFT_42850 [Rhodotorula graminis WP1]|uniref:Uncharacterized protein n=1 Tax=Rhodotorula graminis (strain WP1) TaxID=578459 RepID=A0A194S7I1_RHOGW|nr:uncharacterized protein RHOBADRAFT_42850 [Rhodotorula graminis WP1]KPV76509.1 hypothetical protein RHOBADRAFT_42850 [Rhodotorula graminis WP1]